MVSLIVVNSFGPMASTLLAGLLEKMGYLNVPVRKLGLHRYLMGEVSLDSGLMQARIEKILQEHSSPTFSSGGVSVLDRANQSAKPRTDIAKVSAELTAYKEQQFQTIQDLYFATKNLYAKAVTYKTAPVSSNKHLELTVDIPLYNLEVLRQRYIEEFESVTFIHLHRPFRNWIGATASQAFVNKSTRKRYYFFPHKRYDDFRKYERETRLSPGLHIEFSELFEHDIDKLYDRIANYIGCSKPPVDLSREEFDMYGKLIPFERAFHPYDDGVPYLSAKTLDYFEKQIENSQFTNKLGGFLAWTKYLCDMHKFRHRYSRTNIDKI